MKRIASMLTLWIAFAAPMAFAAGSDDRELDPRVRANAEVMWKKMANKDGMITQQVLMDMVMKKFKEMDKSNKGMISTADALRIMMLLTGYTDAQ